MEVKPSWDLWMEELSLPLLFSCQLPVPRGSVADQTPCCSLTSDFSVKVAELIGRISWLLEAKRKNIWLVPSQYVERSGVCSGSHLKAKVFMTASLEDMLKSLQSEQNSDMRVSQCTLLDCVSSLCCTWMLHKMITQGVVWRTKTKSLTVKFFFTLFSCSQGSKYSTKSRTNAWKTNVSLTWFKKLTSRKERVIERGPWHRQTQPEKTKN